MILKSHSIAAFCAPAARLGENVKAALRCPDIWSWSFFDNLYIYTFGKI